MADAVLNPYRQEDALPSTKGLWLACLGGFSLLYLLTCQRGVSWQDSGMFQWRVLTGDYSGRLGLALAHPLYIAAGRAFCAIPVGTFAGRLNFLSGLGMAVALANLAAVATLLTRRRWIGLASAVMLSVAHAVWWLSTIAEVYTWSVAGLTAEVWLLVLLLRKPSWRLLAALALVNGLGLCVHNFALLSLPIHLVVAVALIARKRLPAWSLTPAGGAWICGAGLYLAMTVHLAVESGSLAGAVRSALVGEYAEEVLNVTGASKYMLYNAALGALSFVSFLLPLAVVGWMRLRKRLGGATAAALAAVTAIHVVFVVRYSVRDQFTFMLPSLCMIALASAVGLSVLVGAGRRGRAVAFAAAALSIVAPPCVYAAGPRLTKMAGVSIHRERELPFRDEMRYWMVPWKHNERSAELFAEAALREAEPDGVIAPDDTSVHPLLLVKRRERIAPRVSIQHKGEPLPKYEPDNPGAFKEALAGRSVLLISKSISHLPRIFRDREYVEAVERDPSGRHIPGIFRDAKLVPTVGGVLYRLQWKAPGDD